MLKNFFKNEQGQALAEYTILLGLMAIVLIGSLTVLGKSADSRLVAVKEGIEPTRVERIEKERVPISDWAMERLPEREEHESNFWDQIKEAVKEKIPAEGFIATEAKEEAEKEMKKAEELPEMVATKEEYKAPAEEAMKEKVEAVPEMAAKEAYKVPVEDAAMEEKAVEKYAVKKMAEEMEAMEMEAMEMEEVAYEKLYDVCK